MITNEERELFEKSIIAQDDDNDYSESGWVAVVVKNWAALTRYSHCSCFGTWTSITEGKQTPRWDWSGTPEQLIKMAILGSDPAMLDRAADPEDYDYDHLMSVYQQILKWSETKFIQPS